MVSYINQLVENFQGIKTFIRHMDPRHGEAQKLLLDDTYFMCYTVHPSSTKMQLNLKKMYWWTEMKRDVGRYVENCLTCLQVKTNHQKLGGEVQSLPIPVRKWDEITMDFVTKLPRTSREHDYIWVVVDLLTKPA